MKRAVSIALVMAGLCGAVFAQGLGSPRQNGGAMAGAGGTYHAEQASRGQGGGANQAEQASRAYTRVSALKPWLKAVSPHFLFIFQEQDRAAVDELLGICEEAYAMVTGFFKSYPARVPVIVFGRTEVANGWTTVLPLHILVNVAAPSGITFGSKNRSWLQLVLTHELVHYVHMTIPRGLFGALSRVFGPDASAAPIAFLPGWMIEGPSTELETLFTDGGRGRNPWWEWYTKAPVMEGRLSSLDQAAYSSAYPPEGHRIYVDGRVMVDYILRRFGGDSFTKILDDYLRFPFFGPWGAIRRVTGATARKIWADMAMELSVKYSADAALTAGRLLTPDRIADYTHPQATSRGLYLLRSDLDSFPSIIRYDPDTQKETVILEAGLSDSYSFTADASGRTIWLTAIRMEGAEPPQAEAYTDLYAYDVNGRRLSRLTRGARLIQPAVSADGTRLVAVQLCGSYSRLVLVDQKSGSYRAVFSREGALITAPAVSPRGNLAAFTMNVNGFQDVYVLDLERAYAGSVLLPDPQSPVTDLNAGLAWAVLGPDPFGEFMPAFASDDSLLFSSDRTGSLCLYRAELGTGGVSLIQRDPVGAGHGIMVGDSLVYGSYTSKGMCLKATDAAGIVPEPLEQEAPQEYPASLPVASSVPAAPYHDVPLPLVWFPLPTLTPTGPDAQETGLGIQVFGGSLLGKWAWIMEADWLFTSMQPGARIMLDGYLSGIGVLRLSMGLGYGWAADPSGGRYVQTLSGSAGLVVPLLSLAFMNASYSMTVSTGVSYIASLSRGAPFSVADSLSGAALSGQSYATVDSTFGYSASTAGGRMDMFSPWAFEASLSNTLLPPLFSASAWGDLAGLTLAVDIPSPLRHQVVKLGLKASHGMGPYQSRADVLAVPRGGFSDPFAFGPAGRALAAIDYLIPIALLDAPLPLGFNLTGLAAGVHVEGAADWGLDPLSFTASSSLWVGAEVMVTAGFNSFSSPICVGVEARIDTANPASFSAATDIKLYIITSFDSFGALTAAATSAAFKGGRVTGDDPPVL